MKKSCIRGIISIFSVVIILLLCTSVSVFAENPAPEGYVLISFSDNSKRADGDSGSFPTPLGTIIPPTKVPFYEGENAASVAIRLLKAKGFEYTASGTAKDSFYLQSINNFEDDTYRTISHFGEFDAGATSGWMMSANGSFNNMGASMTLLNDGDIIRYEYIAYFNWSDTSADISGVLFENTDISIEPEFQKEIKQYTVNVPENLDTIELEATFNNLMTVITYKANNKTYNMLSPIEIDEGTVITINSAYYDYMTGEALNTDSITLTVHKVEKEVQTYKVIFVDGFGNTLSEQTVNAGESAVAPEIKKDGYKFVKWNRDFSNVSSNLTVTAIWEKVIIEENDDDENEEEPTPPAIPDTGSDNTAMIIAFTLILTFNASILLSTRKKEIRE